MYDAAKIWNGIAAQPRFKLWYPNEFVVRFLSKYVRLLPHAMHMELHDTKWILDLGCGAGRHVVMLAKEGYRVAGLDISSAAIQMAESWLQAERFTDNLQLRTDLRVGSAVALPWPDNFFDVIISHGCLDHMTQAESEKAVAECHRVLRSQGLFYCDLVSTLESGYQHGPHVEGKTYIVPAGDKAGAMQRFFDLPDVEQLLEPTFRILDCVLSQWEPVIGQGLSNLDKNGAPYPRAARYHVVARKA